MMQISIDDIREKFDYSCDLFIFGIGFDKRSLSILERVDRNRIKKIIGIKNMGWMEANQKTLDVFNALSVGNAVVIGKGNNDAIEITDEVQSYLRDDVLRKIAIDITSFSHELLTILVGLMMADKEINLQAYYTSAGKYSYNTNKEDLWLSKGVRSIRSVLGFPGVMLPSRKTHLILLVGFEVERASEVILRLECESISIGSGTKESAIKDEHYNLNLGFYDKLGEFINKNQSKELHVLNFHFASDDAMVTKELIQRHIRDNKLNENYNIVICPLNTKIATIGVALLATEHPEYQICYAEPVEYNTDGYAEPGDVVRCFKIPH